MVAAGGRGPVSPRRRLVAMGAVAALLVAVAFMVAGSSASPLCDPDGVLQAHGGWHLFMAIALGSYFMAMSDVRAAAFDREGASA